jgi:hypothetical protein
MTREQLEHAIRAACDVAHDLAASKLVAYREKDRDFVRTLLVEHLISPGVLLDRIGDLDVPLEQGSRLEKWVSMTAEEIDEVQRPD